MMKQLLCFDAKQSHRTGSYWCVKFRGSIQPHLLPVCKGQKWADVVLPKGNKNTFQPFQLQTFSCVFARRQWSSKWLQFDNLWTREIDDGSVQGSLTFGMMPVPRRFNGINMWPVTFFQRPAVPLWLCNFLFCDYLVILSLLLNNGWRLLGVLLFCGDFPGCGAIPISRCNRHLANTQNLQQQHTHFFLSKNNTCSIWATLLAL